MSSAPITQAAEAAVLPSHWRGELKHLLALGLPMAATQLVQFFIYTIDVIMIGRVSTDDLAASSLGLVIVFLLWMIGAGPVAAVTPLVSQALGANKYAYDDVRDTVRMSLWVIALMTPIIIFAVLFTAPVLIALGQDPVISKKAASYVLMLSFGLPFALAVMSLRNFLAAINKTTLPLILVIVATSLNAFFNYLLIFGHWGFPRMELLGAGIASSIAYFLSFVFFVIYIRLDKQARVFDLFKNFFTPVWDRFKAIVTLGWPISLTTVFEGMLFSACTLLMGLIGTIEIAAYQIALNVATLAFMFPWGLSMAGSVRVGLAAGAGNHAAVKRAGLLTIFVSIIAIGFAAVPITLFPDFISGLYLDNSSTGGATGGGEDKIAVHNFVIVFLPLAAAFMFFDSIQVAANQLLRGLKDVRAPMWLTGISYWVIGFPTAWYLGLKTEVGPNGIWYGLMVGLITASILLGGRLYWLVWKTRRYTQLVDSAPE